MSAPIAPNVKAVSLRLSPLETLEPFAEKVTTSAESLFAARQPVSPTLLLRYAAAKPDNKDKSDGFVPCNVRVSQELGNSGFIEW